MPPKIDLTTASPEVQKKYAELEAEMKELTKDFVEANAAEPETPANVTQLNMQQFADMIGESIKQNLQGLSAVDRRHGVLPTDAPDDLNKLSKEERSKRFLRAVFFKDHVNAIKYGNGFLQADGAPVQKNGLVEGTPASGGYLVPTEFMAEVLRIAGTFGVARQQCRIIPMAVQSMNVPTAGATGVSVYWPGEATAGTESSPNFGQKTLTAKQMVALSPFSDELLGDSAIDVVSYVYELFAEAIAKEEDTQWLRGSGSPFTGITGDSNVKVVTMTKNSFTNINPDDLLDMTYAVVKGARINARFYLGDDILKVIRKLKDNEGQYIFNRPTDNQPGTIWGYPYTETEVMPALSDSAADTKFIAFGSGRYTLFGDRKQITMDVSGDAVVNSVSMFETNQKAMRIIERIAITLGIPGAYSVLKTAA